MICDCCNNESCTKSIGVASIPGVPMSILWGDKCINFPDGIVIPDFACEYFFIHVANGNLDNLIDEIKEYYTWTDKQYMKFTEFVKRITPEQVKKEIEEYENGERI